MQRSRVYILGASGSGTTTLARALADRWAVPHADVDDYFWLPTDPPYTSKRAPDDRLALMHQLFVPRSAWVLSGSMLGWGDEVAGHCDAVIYVTLDAEERLHRLERREARRRDGRDGDEDEFRAFLDWARLYDDPTFEGRSRVTHEAWLAGVPQPVLRLDSSHPVAELVDHILGWDPR